MLKRIRELREARGIIPQQMAACLDISVEKYLRFETGKIQMRTPILLGIAKCLDCSMDYLLERSDKPYLLYNEKE